MGHARPGGRQDYELQLAAAETLGRLGRWSWDLRRNRLQWSPELQRLYGFDPDELSSTREAYLDLLHPDDRGPARHAIEEALSTGEPLLVENRVRRPDGTLMWLRSMGLVIHDAAGAPVRMVGMSRDVTAEHRAEEALRRSEGRARLLERLLPAVSRTPDLGSALVLTLQEVGAAIGWDIGVAWLPRGQGGRLEPGPSWHSGADGLDAFRQAAAASRPEAGTGPAGRAWATGRPVWVRDVTAERGWPCRADARRAGLGRGLAVPVRAGERIVAVLELFSVGTESRDDRTLAVVTAAAEALGGAIQHRELEERHQDFLRDPLTGLGNRDYFIDRLTLALVRSRPRSGGLAVVYIDVDGFRGINRLLGGANGDLLLTAVAERLHSLCGPNDTLARIGPDEFAWLSSSSSRTGAPDPVALADRVADGFGAPFALEDRDVFLTASVGVALSDGGPGGPGGPGGADAMLRDAELAGQLAKGSGRGRFHVFGQADIGSLQRLELEQELRRALRRGEFRLVYQPTVSLTSGRVAGVEALVRWEHPDRGLLSPGEFIPLAEETGLISQIGAWVVGEACRHARLWSRAGAFADGARVWMNLSAQELGGPDLVPMIADSLDAAGIDGSVIGFEITESGLMADMDVAGSTLRQLRTRGIQLAIDDFGTGYSSLAHLKRFPFDVLKIDRAFVRGLGVDPDDSTIVAAVIALAGSMRLVTVAEGVETWTQLSELGLLGCDVVQGYYLAEPAPYSRTMFSTRFPIVPGDVDIDLGEEGRGRAALALGAG